MGATYMSLFKKKTADAPQAEAKEQEMIELFGQHEELKGFSTAVSTDGVRHTLESEGAVRFYENGMIVFNEDKKEMLKKALYKPSFLPTKLSEQMRFLYSDVQRAYHIKKGTIRIELIGGSYAYFIFFVLNKAAKEAFCGRLAMHSITVEPFEGK